MSNPLQGKSISGKIMHYSVGALIERDGKYLLIDRLKPPFGYAGIAGHIDKGEESRPALIREVQEESGLSIIEAKVILMEEIENNTCSKGTSIHYWYLYKCRTEGEIRLKPDEAKTIGWYTQQQIQQLNQQQKLEPIWQHWFQKLKIIPSNL